MKDEKYINMFDIVIAKDTMHGLTKNHAYVVRDKIGSKLIQINNDLGENEFYLKDYFRLYQNGKFEEMLG